jgi:HEAT repeat protein
MNNRPSDPVGGASARTPAATGFFTTDRELIVRSWDATIAQMTGLEAAVAKGCRLQEIVPDLQERGLLDLIRQPLTSGATQVLAPALHGYLISCAPAAPSAFFDRMRQRVIVTPLQDGTELVGLAFAVEDVTDRMERERHLHEQLRASDSQLRDDDWQVRRAAVDTMSARRDADLLHALVAALRDGHRDFNLLSSALKLLTVSGLDAAVALAELLQDPDPDLRIQAALALGTQHGPVAVDALIRALDDPDTNVRFHAIEAVGKLAAVRAVEPLISVLQTRDFFLAFPALDALTRIGDPHAAGPIAALLDDPLLGAAAADALGQLGDEEVVVPLLAALEQSAVPVGALVDALVAIHGSYDETPGAASHIEDLVSASIGPTGRDRLLEQVRRSSGVHLKNVVIVLGWLRDDGSIQRSLAELLGTASVNHEVIEALVRFGSAMVDVLVEQLDDTDPQTRRATVVALGRIGDQAAVPALLPLLELHDRDLLVAAASALARIGDERAFEPLLRLIGSPETAVRQAAVGALNSLGSPQLAARIGELLGSPDAHVRESAVRIAGYFGDPGCAGTLIARAADDDEAVRAAAIEHLGYLDDPQVLPILLASLHGGTPRTRAAAAQGLAYVDEAGVVDALRDALRDPDPWVRYFSATSLGRQRAVDAFDDLAAAANADTARQVRVAAVEAIGAVNGERAIELLAALSASDDTDLATAAVHALGLTGSDAAVPVLCAAMRSNDAARRAAAVQALACAVNDAGIEALEWAASADADATVSMGAIAALESIASLRPAYTAAAVPALVRVATATAAAARPRVVAALVSLADKAIPALGAVLSWPEVSARAVAVEVLGRMARPDASTYLVQALDDGESAIRQRAVTALARLGTRGIGRRLTIMARSDESPAVRRAAELALARAHDAERAV